MTHTPHSDMPASKPRAVERLSAIYQRFFPPRHGHGFLKNWIHHLPVIIGLSLLVAFLAHLGWFHGLQSLALDSLLLSQSSRRSDQVVIVTIGDNEFQSPKLFNGTSPLNPEKLGLILQAVAAGKPRVIAVDIDTSSTTAAARYQQLAESIRGDGWPPVIWSVDGVVAPGHHGGHGVPPLHIVPALAGSPTPLSGLITLPCDADGVIRRYCRSYSTVSEHDHHPAHTDSLPWATFKEYRRNSVESKHAVRDEHHEEMGPHELLMNFPGDRYTFVHIAAQTALDSYAQREFWSSEKSPIRDKIVLIGGTYRAARDVHPTPVGQVPGVELLAMAIESELQGTGIRFMHEALSILIDILFGSLLVYLNWRFVSPRAMFLNLLAVGVLALVASYITFNTTGYWLNFAVVLVGIWLHNQLDVVRELPSLHREVHDLKSKLSEYERAGVTHKREQTTAFRDAPHGQSS